ncbi:hypothetical protein DQ04_23811000 [Trypanosoma grayi]|uniref:hypothetical protein n=1 Tax=Trypanosoma grayi TaxID=71804 RepID=UPI0004F45EC6|nr:hypothetical protein DQ04_23811000 [Trypanosoma grayi]KEG05303.1 hypothetical protein DQ04_23811000 [Trypanosoma grayi]
MGSPGLLLLFPLLLALTLLTTVLRVSANEGDAAFNALPSNDAADFVPDDHHHQRQKQWDRGEEALAVEQQMIKRMMEDSARRDAARREQRRRVHLLFLEAHQRISAYKPMRADELFPLSMRADYLRMRRIVLRRNGGETLLQAILTLIIWTVPFVSLAVWQFA